MGVPCTLVMTKKHVFFNFSITDGGKNPILYVWLLLRVRVRPVKLVRVVSLIFEISKMRDHLCRIATRNLVQKNNVSCDPLDNDIDMAYIVSSQFHVNKINLFVASLM